MKLSKVTIGRLMVVVLFLAFGLSALARPTRLGGSIRSAPIRSAPTVALIGVVIDRGTRRMCSVGFLIAGWSCIVMDYWGEIDDQFNRWDLPTSIIQGPQDLFSTQSQTDSITTIAVALPPPPMTRPLQPLSPGTCVFPAPLMPPPPFDPGLTGRDPAVFARTVHRLPAWSAAMTGGLVARWIHAARREDDRP